MSQVATYYEFQTTSMEGVSMIISKILFTLILCLIGEAFATGPEIVRTLELEGGWYLGSRALIEGNTLVTGRVKNSGPRESAQVVAEHIDTGEKLWSAQVDAFIDDMVITKGVLVLITRRERLYGFSFANGSLLWSHATQSGDSILDGLFIGSD